jgi:radical SAM protein with 4Fe4S-binding SPASM domain
MKLDFDLDKIRPCKYIWCMPIIAYNGDVTVCCNDNFFELKLGNINDAPLEDIWTNEKAKQLRLLHITNQLESTPGKKCYWCRKHWKIPEMEHSWIIDYLKSIGKEDLIEPYLARFRSNEKPGEHCTFQEIPVSALLTDKPAAFSYNNEDNFNKGYAFSAFTAPNSLHFPIKVPKQAKSVTLALNVAGVDGKAFIRPVFAQTPLDEVSIQELASGHGQPYRIIIDKPSHLRVLAQAQDFEIQIQVVKGTLAVLEEPIEEGLERTPPTIVFRE